MMRTTVVSLDGLIHHPFTHMKNTFSTYRTAYLTLKEENSQEEEGQDVMMEDKPVCNDPYCKCPCHGNMGPPPPPPPPPTYSGHLSNRCSLDTRVIRT